MAPPTDDLIERMSDAGFGEPMHVLASDVLTRLKTVAGGSQGGTLIESSIHSQ
jgi:hypothetical protein